MKPGFDSKDAELLSQYLKAREQIKGPRVGDFVRCKDGSLKRFTHDWGESIQVTSTTQNLDESFHLCESGHVSFSGGLDLPINNKP